MILLATAANAWARDGKVVHGAALAGKAADGLESASGIQSRTLASLELSWENGNTPIKRGDVLVVDEAGMVGTCQMARITERMQGIGAKLVLVGDPEQLQPIEAGTPFKDMVAMHGAAELKDIHRQREDWQKHASRDLADGKIEKAVQTYDQRGAVTRTDEKSEAIEALVERDALDVAADAQRPKDEVARTRIALAHKRQDVHLLNQAIRGALRDEATRAADQRIETEFCLAATIKTSA
jgi:ATP-dependent exoDNAse (exonuclease V) alpha subunit